jgi:hypothetical protein
MNERQRRAAHLDAWRRSEAFREIARAQALKMIADHRRKPRCGATKRTDGGPCQQPAMANGRCRFHGGSTPRGDGWHRPTWPEDGAKWAAKGRDRDRAARQRARRLAKMTPEERSAHERWQASHRPGPPGPRVAAREGRRRSRELTSVVDRSGDQRPRNPKTEALGLLATELRRQVAQLEAERDRIPNCFD